MTYTQAAEKLKENGYKIKSRILVCINEPEQCIGLEVGGISPLVKDEELRSIRGLLPGAKVNWMPNDGYVLIQII